MPESVFSQRLREIGRDVVNTDNTGPDTEFDNPAPRQRSFSARANDFLFGAEVGPREQFEIDRRTLDPATFARKYGAEAETDRVFSRPEENLDTVQLGLERGYRRTNGERLNDYSRQFGGGLAQGGAGLLNLAVLAAGTQYSVDTRGIRKSIAEGADGINSFLLKDESDAIKRMAAIAAQQKKAKLADSEAILSSSDGSLSDQLKKIGRDVMIEGQSVAENGALNTKTVANATGSLIPSLIGSGGLTAIARGGVRAAGLEGTKRGAAITTTTTAGAIGGIEGQGAYNQTVTEIGRMTEEQLQKGSHEYRQLREQGLSHEEAQLEVGHLAGKKAQILQTGIATAVGFTVAKFEGNPLSREIARKNALVVLSQTAEEAIQSATGEFSGNVGIRAFADENRQLSHGVGEAGVQGAVGGFGATSVITTPTALAETVRQARDGFASVADHAVKVRAEEQRRRFDDQSTVGEKATSGNIDQLETLLNNAQRISELHQAAQTAEPGTVDDASLQTVADVANESRNAPIWLTDTASQEYTERTAAFSDDVVQGSRIGTLRKVLSKLNNGKFENAEQERAAADFAIEEVQAIQEFTEEALTKEDSSPVEQASAELATSVLTNKVFSTGFDKATEVLNSSATEGSPAQAATPREAVLNPVGIDASRVTDETVAQMSPGVSETTAASVATVIRAITSPETQAATGATTAAARGRTNSRAGTRKELLFTSKRASYGVIPSFNDLVSMALRGAIKNERTGSTIVTDPRGNQVDAVDSVARLQKLIQHQLNKYQAAVESLDFAQNNPGKDSSVQYETLDPRTGETFSTREEGKKIFINPRSANSIETFNQIREDANVGIRAYNALIEQFPDLFQGQAFEEIPAPTNAPTAPQQEQQAQDAPAQQTQDTTQTPPIETAPAEQAAVADNALDFDGLFDGGNETTLQGAVTYLSQQPNLDPGQQAILALIANSAFAQSNPNTKIRRGLNSDQKPRPETRGWWDPVKQEIVLFDPAISELLHEMLHAVTLEALNQNVFTTYNNVGRALTVPEQAAKRLVEMANAFMDSAPENDRVAEIQAMMRQLIESDVENQGTRGHVLAINEFMAYGLTEKAIQDALAARTHERPNLARRIIDAIKRLLGVGRQDTVLDKVFYDTHTLAQDYQAAVQQQAQTDRAQSNDVTQGSTTESTNQLETPQPARTQDQQEQAPTRSEEAAGRAKPQQQVEETAPANSSVEAVSETQTEPPAVADATPEAAVSATETASPTQSTEEVSSTENAILVGRNLATNIKGEVGVTQAYDLNPTLPIEQTIDEAIDASLDGLDYEVSDDTRAAIDEYLTEADGMIEQMNERLTELLKLPYKKGITYGEVLIKSQTNDPVTDRNGNPVDVTETSRGLVLSFVDKQSILDGNPVYDEHLLRLGLLAAMDYVFNTANGGGVYKAADIIKALGLPSDTTIEPWMYDLLNFGRNATDVKEGLARHIKDFWGAQDNNDVSPNLTKGLAEAFADEILDFLQDADIEGTGWIQKHTDQQGKKTYAAFKLGDRGQELQAAKTILRDVLTDKNSDVHQYRLGETFNNGEVSDTIARDKNIPIPERKRQAIKKQQDTPFKISTGFMDLYQAFGADAFAQILGFTKVGDNDGFFNDSHRKAIEGKNSSIAQSINQVVEQLTRIHAYAEKHGVKPEDVPIHYKLEVSLNGRFFMQGFNPQSNKLAREMFTPTQATIDLNSPGDLQLVYAAIGQAMDDFKVENLGLEESARKAQEYLQRPVFQQAVEAIRNRGQEGSTEALVEAFADKDVESSARLLKALFVAAQLEDAIAAGEQTLDIDLAMELDGKTNGPITAAIQNNTDSFSPQFLSLVRRGGFFIGSRFDGADSDITYAEYKQTQEDSADLYEVTGDVMSTKLAQWRQALEKGTLTDGGTTRPDNIKNANRARYLVLALLKEMGDIDVSPNEETGRMEIRIKRRGTKSPITQNLYGAGGRSIAAGLTNSILKMAYEEITEAVRNENGERVRMLASLIDELADIRLGTNKDTGLIWAQNSPTNPDKSLSSILAKRKLKDLESFTFSGEQADRIVGAINATYIPAFEQALSDTVGSSVKDLNDLLVEATNNHTDAYLAMVRTAIDAETKAQRESGKIRPGHDISKNDYDAILNKFRKFAPVIDAGTSVFSLTGGGVETTSQVDARRTQQAAEGFDKEASFDPRSRTLSGTSSGSKRGALTGAGVKILPYNVIANADVELVTGVYSDERILTDTLAVHDGIEVPVTRLREMSLIMNEKVADSWQLNTLQPVIRAIEGMLELPEFTNDPALAESVQLMRDQLTELYDKSDLRQAKIDALATVQYTVDGVPGAEAPFVKSEGEIFNDEGALIDHLNSEMTRRLAELRAEREASNNETLQDQIEIEPRGGSDLRKTLEANDFSGDPRQLVQALQDSLTDAGQRAVLGELIKSPAYQEALEAGLTVELLPAGSSPVYDGLRNKIYLSNVTGESAIHELVHATTVGQVLDHYNDPSVDPVRAKTIERLESLMNDFLSRSLSSPVEQRLQSVIQKYVDKSEPALALSEFMAWSLSNQNLINKGKGRIATDPASQLRALGKKVIQAMRRLLGFASNKVFDHVLFNTTVLLNNSSDTGSTNNAILRHQIYEDAAETTTDGRRKLELQKRISRQITSFLENRLNGETQQETASRQAQRAAEYAQTELDSFDALSRVEAAGFQINGPQDHLLFRTLQSVFSVDLNLDKRARLEVQKIFEKVTKDVGITQVLEAMGTTVDTATQTQQETAEMMLAVIRGRPFTDLDGEIRFTERDARGLSNRLGTFLALAQTSEVFRNVLSNLDFANLGLQTDIDTSSLDGLISSTTDKIIGSLNYHIVQDTQPQSTAAALDALTEILLSHEAEAASEIETRASGLLAKANQKTKSLLESAGRQAGSALRAKADQVAGTEQNPSVSGDLQSAALGVAAAFSDILVEDRAKAQADALTSVLNDSAVPEAVRNLWAEIRGLNQDTAGILRKVKAAKQQISAVRQEYVEQVPKILAKQFSDDFNQKQEGETNKEFADRVARDWEHLFNGFGKTDITVVMDVLGDKYTLGLFGNTDAKQKARDQAIKETKDRLLSEVKKLGLDDATARIITDAYAAKAAQLGNYQINWETGQNLLSSADAILGLYNEDGASISKENYTKLQKALAEQRSTDGGQVPTTRRGLREITSVIDTLASLEAVNSLSGETQGRLAELISSESSGVSYALSYTKDLRRAEDRKNDTDMARINGLKGNLPSNSRRKYSVIVAPDRDHARLAEQGYVRVRAYESAETKLNPKKRNQSYYFSAHQKLASYNQGALQTVQDTFFGVDPVTGLANGPETTGEMIVGDAAKLLNRRIKARKIEAPDGLIPRFNQHGDLIGFEQALAPDMIQRLEMSNNFAESLGKWGGRIQEERSAYGFNKGLVDALKEAWDEESKFRSDEYAEFGTEEKDNGSVGVTSDLENDPIWRDSYFLIPKDVREYAHEVFDGPIRIRRDLINNALGFRSGSVADVYTGKTRLNKQLTQAMRDIFLATPFLGPDMYKYLTVAEETAQTIVSEVKHVIVVKSGVILAANTLSNIIQLAGREVPLSYMGKRTRSKYAEVAQYKANEDLKIRLRADKLATQSRSKQEGIQARIDAIEESEKRMSIWPLIEANQFTTISEGLTDVDKAIIDGKYMDWVEKKAGELPGALSTVARYAIISKDTALYKGMSRAVQYSDFIAKAVYFDFLTQEKGVAPDEAINRIDAEFINYDLNDSRTRTYLESLGLTWFMNFKLRALKIGLDMARNNPASTLLSLGAASAFGLNAGSPVTDNIAGATADGRLGYSIGPGMVEAGWNLNIWNQIFGK